MSFFLEMLMVACVTAIVGALFLRAITGVFLRKKNLFILYINKGGLGDAAAMTVLMRALHEQRGVRFIVISKHGEIFKNNPLVLRFWNQKKSPVALTVMGALMLLRPANTHKFRYKTKRMPARAGTRHLVEVAADGLKNAPSMPLESRRGSLFLSPEERVTCREKFNITGRFAVIVSEGKTSFTPNKEWGAANFQAVVTALPTVQWVQVGLPENKKLCGDGVVDLRGKTTVRELACLIADAVFVLAGEGLHNHLAACVAGISPVTSLVVRSGFHPETFIRYANTICISAPVTPPCAPCWLKTPCPVAGKPCTSDISPTAVETIAEKIWRER